MSNSMTVSKMSVSLFLPHDLVFIYKRLPQNFKVRRLTFRNILKRTKTGVLQRILTLFHRHYPLERNKKNLWQPFLDNFQTKRTKKKWANRSRKSCSHDYGSRGSRTKTNFLKQHQRAVGRRPASALMAFRLHHCHKKCRWLVAYTDREYYPGQKNGHYDYA